MKKLAAASSNQKISLKTSLERWKYVSKNVDVVRQASWLEETLAKGDQYQHYQQIPTVSDLIVDLLDYENRKKRLLYERKRGINQDRALTATHKQMESLIRKHKIVSGHRDGEKPDQDNTVDVVVSIVRMSPDERTKTQLEFLLTWLKDHTKPRSVVSNYLQDCTHDLAIEFVRGLMYTIEDSNNFIIRQNDVGDEYYILLSGICAVYVNENLFEKEKPFYKHDGRNGLGKFIDTFDAGFDFGEMALISDKPRTASIVTKDICELLVCTREHFSKCIKEYANLTLMTMVQDLAAFKCFEDVQEAYMKTVIKRFRRVRLRAGAVLQTEGEFCKTVYLLSEGTCSETKRMAPLHSTHITDPHLLSDVPRKNGDVPREILQTVCPATIGAYYAMKKKRPLTTITCSTACEGIAVSSEYFNQSVPQVNKQMFLDVVTARHKLVVKRLKDLEKLLSLQERNRTEGKVMFRKQMIAKSPVRAGTSSRQRSMTLGSVRLSTVPATELPRPRSMSIFDTDIRRSLERLDVSVPQMDKSRMSRLNADEDGYRVFQSGVRFEAEQRDRMLAKRSRSMSERKRKGSALVRSLNSKLRSRSRSQMVDLNVQSEKYPVRANALSLDRQASRVLRRVRSDTAKLERHFGQHLGGQLPTRAKSVSFVKGASKKKKKKPMRGRSLSLRRERTEASVGEADILFVE